MIAWQGGIWLKIVSWNVNGLAACCRKGFLRFLAAEKPDIMCCQEIKTVRPLNVPGYEQYWNPAQRPGYSGTLVLAKQTPISWSAGFEDGELDEEGRVITLEYRDYYVVNVYVPSIHPHNAPDRPDFRIKWDAALRKYLLGLQKPIILCGDLNATRAYIDSYPENGKNEPDNPLFRSEERASLERLLEFGLIDAFRTLNPSKEGAYTWWGPKNNDRSQNRGSRLDYFLVSGELLPFVREIRFHDTVLASDHCPISMMFFPVKPRRDLDDDDMTAIWQAIDWNRLQESLLSLQQDLAYAAYNREWEEVRRLQDRVVGSWAARALAVRFVADRKAAPGVDGVTWDTPAQKARAALFLTARGYRPLPYLYRELEEKGKCRANLIPAMRDKAMQVLYSYALDPVAESTADSQSFFARKGRSSLDAHAYLSRELSGSDSPKWVVVTDVQTFYGTVTHSWLIEHIPIDTVVLRKFRKAGMVRDSELFPTEKGMSMATSLSPILGNMMLDGLQSYIYDRLYPHGGVDYLNGSLTRLCDDIVITARSEKDGYMILQAVSEFLADRGLKPHPDKTKVVSIRKRFDFIGRHYQLQGSVLKVRPADSSIRSIEQKLKDLIENFSGTQRDIIREINWELTGWSTYHQVEDSYMEFRHIDAIVEGLLVKKMCGKYPRWHRETILRKFWTNDGPYKIFALPKDPTVRVKRLASLPIVTHNPVRTKFNYYLDQDYQNFLKHRRDAQKSSGRYRGIWTRQSGRCAYCGERMLPDQEVRLVERDLGQGWIPRNLIYIHQRCAYNVSFGLGDVVADNIDLFELLDDFLTEAPAEESPYLELTEFFRTSKHTTLHMGFKELEYILGDPLPWEAYRYKAFWYDDTPDRSSPMWRDEGFPFGALKFSQQSYNITDSWVSQGYKIKTLDLAASAVTFRRDDKNSSGIVLPKELIRRRLPDDVVYNLNKLLKQFVRENGL